MKKVIFYILGIFLSTICFCQQKADLVEIGVDENDPESYRAREVLMPDGTTKVMFFKVKHFSKESMKVYSSFATVSSTEEMIQTIELKKKYNECLKEMYEEKGYFYMLFRKCDSDAKK